MRASSYLPTLDKLKVRGALVNINNKNDEKCFQWSVLASIHKFRDTPSLVSHYKRFENTINMDGILYPVKLHQIGRSECLNQNISVNAFAYEDDKVFPVRIPENKSRKHHVNLLVVNDNENHDYILIRNFSRLLSKQYKSYNGRLYFCPYCLHGCTSQRVLDDRQERFKLHGAQWVRLPEKDGKNDKVMEMI